MGELGDPDSPRSKIVIMPEAGTESYDIFLYFLVFLYPTLCLLLLKCFAVLLHYTDLGDVPDT